MVKQGRQLKRYFRNGLAIKFLRDGAPGGKNFLCKSFYIRHMLTKNRQYIEGPRGGGLVEGLADLEGIAVDIATASDVTRWKGC